MKTLEELQNDFAINNGYENIAELIGECVTKGNTLRILLDLYKICIMVQQEQQKIIAENVDNNESKDWYDGTKTNLKSSIINENNIIR